MRWREEKGTLYLDGEAVLDANTILLYENGDSSDETIPPPSKEIPSISFSMSNYISSLSARIFVPSDAKMRKPYLVLIACDPDFFEHEITNTFLGNYIVWDGVFLIFDTSLLSLLQEILSIAQKPGPLDFGKLAQFYNSNNELIEYRTDDSRCPKVEDIVVPSPSKEITLYPYQQNGVSWMNSVVQEGVGCVLADEMGLGKTFQIVALLKYLQPLGISLVIAPNSLLDNWKRELLRFAPSLEVSIHRGSKRINFWKDFLPYDVVITSYDTAVCDFSLIYQVEWNLLVLDEAQAIKNQGSMRSRIIRDIPKHAGIAVSGTPFENHITDIWSIYDFCFRNLLGSSSEFKQRYSDTQKSASEVEKIISPLLLRRLVKDVKKELPEKVIITEVLSLNEDEAIGYEQIRMDRETRNGGLTLGAIAKLRQYCAMPKLANPSFSEIGSAKFQRLAEILDEIHACHEKVLIFTSYREIQKEICNLALNHYCCEASLLNGSVPIKDRQGVVDNFSNYKGFSMLVINPTVGGTGLNITAANHVIFYTLDWNPALEDQCLARALRIGQEKTVFVHRMFYCNTVEEVINDRLSRKRDLSETVIRGIDGQETADIKKALTLSPFSGGNLEYESNNL
jgi:SNF2 family DNA or RNA helicase